MKISKLNLNCFTQNELTQSNKLFVNGGIGLGGPTLPPLVEYDEFGNPIYSAGPKGNGTSAQSSNNGATIVPIPVTIIVIPPPKTN